MKQQKRHNKPAKKKQSAKDNAKYLSWLFIVPACAYLLWFWHIDNKTLFEPEWWWLIVFAIIGFAVGIIRKSKFPQNPKRSVRFSGKRTKRSVQKRKARNTQKAETKVL